MNKFGKLKQDYLIACKQASRMNFERCDFNNDCDFCVNPKLGTFAYGCYEYEVDGYICGKCILKRRNKNKVSNSNTN